MIPDDLQDKAIAYVLGELSPAQRGAFENELQREPEVKAFVGEIRETLGRLAQAAQETMPPSNLKTRIMEMAHEKDDRFPVPEMRIQARTERRSPAVWMALSAVLFIMALAAAFDVWSTRARYDAQDAQIASLNQELAHLRGDLESQREQMDALEKDNSVSRTQVFTLKSLVAPLANAMAVVVWNPKQQQGLIKGEHLLGAGLGKDYQLWIIDPSTPTPISAGVIAVGGDGSFATTFKPVHPVSSVAKFAISLEASGGSISPRGPIVFVGG